MKLWGIDLGGTKIEGVVLEVSTGHDGRFVSKGDAVLARLRIATEADNGYGHVVSQVASLVGQLESATGLPRPSTIGIGTPGVAVPSTGLMKNCNTTCLNGQPLQSDLSAAVGCPVYLANDADCFALAEAVLGAARGYRTVFGVIIGTGVGGGFVLDGGIVTGPNGLTGEWGHTTLVPEGNACYCGRRGCVETYLSGPAVERAYFGRTGEKMRLADIAAIAERADPTDTRMRECQETIVTMCDDFGKSLSAVVNILDPGAIVLGGGAGQVPQLKSLGRQRLAENVFGPDFSTPLLAPELGDSAGVFGAALLSAGP